MTPAQRRVITAFVPCLPRRSHLPINNAAAARRTFSNTTPKLSSSTNNTAPDDKGIWDALMSQWRLPSLSVAIELKLFDIVRQGPKAGLTVSEIADKLSLPKSNGLQALVEALSAQNYLIRTTAAAGYGDGGKSRPDEASFQCADESSTFCVSTSPKFYWGNMIGSKVVGGPLDRHDLLMDAILKKHIDTVADDWDAGAVTLDLAAELNAAFHSHSVPSAMGAAAAYPLGGTRRLLDVGGGSGCFSIEFAKKNAGLEATVMDLPSVCEVTKKRYFEENADVDDDVKARLHVLTRNMFRQEWPSAGEYDAIFMSNILHDWSMETCKELLRKSFDALPPGGKMLLHEMLLDSNHVTPAFFSIHMAVFTLGKQFYFYELKEMLEGVGFVSVEETPAHGYYSIVSGMKPST